jgi:high-affinity iron transporter
MAAADTAVARPPTKRRAQPDGERAAAFYVWVAVVLAMAVTAVILGWHARGGTADPTALGHGEHMGRTTAVVDSAILVFREGLETILVLAAITAGFRGSHQGYRRPVGIGGGLALLATLATWFLAEWVIGAFGGRGLDVQAATGLPAIVVLLVVMNWFFHRIYWTGWISHHHKRRRTLVGGRPADERAVLRRTMLGLGLLGFTSVYREGFEVVVFLQNLRVAFGSSVVLEGVALGSLFTAAIGVLTFTLHRRLPYKKLLIITGALLVVVLFVMVGEEVNEMQQAGWIGTTAIPGLHFPGWAGTWFSLFGNVQTIAAQLAAVTLVLGSYVAAQYLRVWKPRRLAAASEPAAPTPLEPVQG